VQHFEAALDLQPEVPKYRVSLLETLMALGQFDAAQKVLAATPLRAQFQVGYHVSRTQALAPLAETDVYRKWLVGMGPVSPPAYDPIRRLLVVPDWDGNAMAGDVDSTYVSVLDADTGRRLETGGDEAVWAAHAGAFGFEPAFEYRTAESHAELDETRRMDGMTVVGGRGTKIFAGRKVIGKVARAPWELQDGMPRLGVAIFEDRVLVIGHYSIADGCGAHVGARFTVVPLTAPGPMWHRVKTASVRAQRALMAGDVPGARAALADAAIAAEPVVKAWKVLVDARDGKFEAARSGLEALGEPYRSLVLHHPLAAGVLGPASTRVAGAPKGVGVPAYAPSGPNGPRVVMAHPTRRGSFVFFDAQWETRIDGLEVSAAFLAAEGFVAPLGVVKATEAAEGDWRAVLRGEQERRVACGQGRATYVRAGTRVGHGACCGDDRPEEVFFFDGAVVWVGLETVSHRTKDREDSESVAVPRVVFAQP
jgi:hypothetical protein